MSYLTSRQQREEKDQAEAAQFRALLWQVAEALAPGEQLEVFWNSEYRWRPSNTTACFHAAPVDGEKPLPAVVLDLGHVGAHPMMEVGWQYRHGNERERTGLKKATAAWASAEDAAAESKAAAEAATGLPMHGGYDYELRKQTGFEALSAHRRNGSLFITAKLETRPYTPAQLLDLKALLDRFQQEG